MPCPLHAASGVSPAVPPVSCSAASSRGCRSGVRGPRSRAPLVVSAKTMREGVSSHPPSSALPSSSSPRFARIVFANRENTARQSGRAGRGSNHLRADYRRRRMADGVPMRLRTVPARSDRLRLAGSRSSAAVRRPLRTVHQPTHPRRAARNRKIADPIGTQGANLGR
jgi:hypothetical protein